ncbi:subtilisin-like protein [Aspergillus homomorphus CBS 101889]|uniref:tripeptidyl-peptidase II n=1 Tax=Aspergillus homomorphus (strain CBS 101889) TaxID=1450537 RepID=A0A395HTI7_ASPHC|nr:subtilisin-like protein [Aspergillus homomorphus CBS 101889]RAL10809.1 subtilisin-like protein [Aspergillus homomorphus CBS 101889]
MRQISLTIILETLSLLACRYSVVDRLQNVPDGWMRQSGPASSAPMRFWLAMRKPDLSGFEEQVIAWSTPGHRDYGRHLTREELQASMRPSDEAIAKVRSWLEWEHVPAESIEDRGDWLAFTIPLSQAESMMKTQFYHFYHPKTQTTTVRTLTYSVPEEIWPFVQLIQPTTRFGSPQAQDSPETMVPVALTAEDLAGNCSMIVTPTCLRQLYGINDTDITPDQRNRLGISGFLEEYARYDDLEQFLATYAPDQADANFSVVSINGGRNLQYSLSPSSEASLDIQYALSLAYHASAVYYTTGGRGPMVQDSGALTIDDSTNEPYLEQLHYLLSLPDKDLPAVLSTSYGEEEPLVPTAYAEAVCNLFAQLGARGPVFPASCPFVTSVGGTEGISPESAISFSGGGFSEIFARPSYQDSSVTSYLQGLASSFEGLYNPQGRGIPDVSTQANNFVLRDNGEWMKTGGTSAAAPVFAAIITRLNAARLVQGKSTLGFLNPWLYSLKQKGFTDIVDGGSVGSPASPKMATDLRTLLTELHNSLNAHNLEKASALLTTAKRALLQHNSLLPTASTPPDLIPVAREILELGALASIRQTDAPGFTRYYQQLQPFYDLERQTNPASDEKSSTSRGGGSNSQRSKITGLYLLLLLSMGDSTSFHTVLEGLVEEASLQGRSVEDDPFIKYPVELERNLMEGSYDKVWRETNSERVPGEDFELFSSVLVGTIRSEIADCSEKAYPSLPISNAKNLLFMDSEGAVIEFAQQRGWVLRDGRIYFPVEPEAAARSEKDILVASGTIIENAIGYARELETIV